MRLVNLTAHEVRIVLVGGATVSLPPSNLVARIRSQDSFAYVAHLDADEGCDAERVVACYKQSLGNAEGLPEPEDGVLYIVSAMVRASLPERKDLASPGRLLRDGNGVVFGCEGLTVN